MSGKTNPNFKQDTTLLLTCMSIFLSFTSGHTPFGYQSDSSLSPEYELQSETETPVDPSTFAGAIHYDSLHHALYFTGATYASSIFDGLDPYQIQHEKDQLKDGDADNDGYWWEESDTGLRPHIGDVGTPDHSPSKKADCFYAVMSLPENNRDSKVELVHSRRFGSAKTEEACSALDVLFASPSEKAPGGYLHQFDVLKDEHTVPPLHSPVAGPFGPEGPPHGGTLPMGPTPADAAPGTPTMISMDSNQPTSTPSPTGFLNSGPQSRFRALYEDQVVYHDETDKVRTYRHNRRSMQDHVLTRSVRLLMAGHVESPDGKDGYVVSDLHAGRFDEGRVYAFAQQVDVRLPLGGPAQEHIDQMDVHMFDYNLQDYADDPTMKMNSGPQDDGADGLEVLNRTKVQEDLRSVVTSGVDARALINDKLPPNIETQYPVALVADPTTQKHFYVVLLVSQQSNSNDVEGAPRVHTDPTIGEGTGQRSRIEFPLFDQQGQRAANDFFGKNGRPHYGSDYRIILKKVAIETLSSACPDLQSCDTLSDTEETLSAESFNGEKLVMRHTWMQEFVPDLEEDVRPAGLLFAPSGKIGGEGDILVMVGTTTGMGSAFGTNADQGAGKQLDLDGFAMKIRTDTGAFSGRDAFNEVTDNFTNMHSLRIQSLPGKDDILAGMCSKPLRMVGKQEQVRHVFVVGSTAAVLPSVPGTRNNELLSSLKTPDEYDPMEAFLMKIDLDTMNIIWTVQVGAVVNAKCAKGGADGCVQSKGDSFGYSCAVTPDGEDVYFTGLVKNSAVAIDFTSEDDGSDSDLAHGGSDVFVASYKTKDGSRIFLRQIGSSEDDLPSRGSGGITTDRFGNAIVTGNTRGSFMRERDPDEYKYGQSGKEAAADIFIMSFARGTGEHVPIKSNGALPPSPASVAPPVNVNSAASGEGSEKNGSGLSSGVVALLLLTFFSVIVLVATFTYRKKKREKDDHDVPADDWQPATQTYSRDNRLNNFDDLNIMVEVRNSASGGWHGVYDYSNENFGTIDFNPSGGPDDVVFQSLFMEDGLAEIENSAHNDIVGEYDISEEELIQAYDQALAHDTEPENYNLSFRMPSMGSAIHDDDHGLT